jgi:hypothetical protein
MANQDEPPEDRARKERSPSFPFIPLNKAIERARAVAEAHKRSPARLTVVGDTWGYGPKSSGLIQTFAALKAYGLMEDIGRGEDRRIQLTDLAWRILHDTREGARNQALREAAIRPRLISEYAQHWLPERPSDNHCISELHLDRGFTTEAAKLFLRVFDETAAFANLTNSDKMSDDLGAREMPSEQVTYPVESHSGGAIEIRPAAPVAPAVTRRPTFYGGGGEIISPRATLPLPEGIAALEIPQGLTRRSFEALRAWVDLMVTLAQPMPEHANKPPSSDGTST